MYQSKAESKQADELFKAVLCLESAEECYRFFDDICTISELKAIAQRFHVARLLKQGETFNAIAEQTGASSATISRVNRCLLYGADGYQLVLKRLGIESKK